MFLELIATIVAGLAAAGLVLIVNRALGGRLPLWLMPVAAGLSMIGVTVANEYGWYGRTAGALPDGIEIVETVESRAFYRPWSYVFPYVDRFAALDTGSLRQHPDKPGRHMANLVFFARWSPVRGMTVLIDCGERRRAALPPDAEFAEDGDVPGAHWIDAPPGDAVIAAVCGG
ncbi:hypothetical protein SAMN04490248_10517 [Salinihabitans flavidus]|uniref:Uncharacterized protein n=1 Tax=Salinihabitans flavidus TaxID=569882 RepID=A0A1H8PI78_9RHOB|nr:hypothetical protein [Salinihabitans flavidus]SEO41709.1 hypothetical protein SAMN04490248_10517 [Salinihabitans flavidus]